MLRFAHSAFILALTTGIASGADTVESKRSRLDTLGIPIPSPAFGEAFRRFLPNAIPRAILCRNTGPKSGRDGPTGIFTSSLFAPTSSSISNPTRKPTPKPMSCGSGTWPKPSSARTSRTSRGTKNSRSHPQGEWVDLDIDLDTPRHESGWVWNSGFEAAARIDRPNKIWYGFMRIPYEAVDQRPARPGIVSNQSLPLTRSTSQPPVDRLATDSSSYLSRPGGFR